MESNERDLLSSMDLEADNQVRQDLNEGAKWAKFIAIVMFIVAGIVFIAGLAGSVAFSSVFRRLGNEYALLSGFEGPLLVIIFLLIAAVIAVIYYFLFVFSAKIKSALVAENKLELNKGLKALKTFFIITTIIAILGLLNDVYQLFF